MAYPKQPVDHARLSVDEDLNRIRFSAAGTRLVPVLALVLGEPALVRVSTRVRVRARVGTKS